MRSKTAVGTIEGIIFPKKRSQTVAMMESRGAIVHFATVDDDKVADIDNTDDAPVADQYSESSLGVVDEALVTESAKPADTSQRGDTNGGYSSSLHSFDCDSHAKATTVSQIGKCCTINSTDERNVEGAELNREQKYKPSGPSVAAFEALRHDYYVHQKRSKKERRLSSLSMGSAKASSNYRVERYVNLEE
jgi:hypothetical protein